VRTQNTAAAEVYSPAKKTKEKLVPRKKLHYFNKNIKAERGACGSVVG
jgi:hypothetical protein